MTIRLGMSSMTEILQNRSVTIMEQVVESGVTPWKKWPWWANAYNIRPYHAMYYPVYGKHFYMNETTGKWELRKGLLPSRV
jgi:hypothetical protein